MSKKLRLVLFEECNRSCKGCCNQDWDLANLPVCTDFTGYDEVLLTGGEPMLYPQLILKAIYEIRKVNPLAYVFLYTAWTKRPFELLDIAAFCDGLTLTLHKQQDVIPFTEFNILIVNLPGWDRLHLRLNVFQGINLSGIATERWKVKDDITWIKDCPLPEGEVLMRF